MYCKNCGKQISENSKYCLNCGDKVIIETADHNQSYAPPPNDDAFSAVYQGTVEPTEDESEKIRNKSFKFAAGFFIVVTAFCIWAVSTSSPEKESSVSTAPTVASVTQTAVSSKPALSPRQQQIEDVFENQAQWQFEGTIKRLLKNPDTASFNHNKSSWAADNAILTGSGTVSYKNSKDQKVSEPFTVSIIMNDETYLALYIELNKFVSTNILDKVDNTGCATQLGAQDFGVAAGNSIFQKNSNQIVTIMYEEGKQSTPSKPSKAASSSSKSTQTQSPKPSNGTTDYSDWIGYDPGDSWDEAAKYMAQGLVIYFDGQYYASPKLAKMWENEVVAYYHDIASDPKE